jgi:hypothetical protein
MLLHGDRGVGKRSLIQHLLHSDLSRLPKLDGVETHVLRFDDDVSQEPELCAQLAPLLQTDAPPTLDAFTRFLRTVPQRHLVVVENGEKIFTRTARGFDMCQRFLRMIGETSDQVLWVVLMGTPAATLLETTIGLYDYFTHSFEVRPLNERELEDMLGRRHRVSGFGAVYARPRPRILPALRRPFTTYDRIGNPRGHFYDRLAELTGGNTMRALLYYLESVELDPSDPHIVRVSPLPEDELPLVAHLSLTKKTLLAALVQHDSMTAAELRQILREDFDTVQNQLEHLERLGFVEAPPGHSVAAYQLRPLAAALIVPELRAMNLV